MASQKGILITVGILSAITIASFLAWIIPTSDDTVLVVSDFENYLDEIKNIHGVIDEELDSEFQKLVSGDISPNEYIKIAKTSTLQINAQIIKIVKSKPTQNWQESYTNYMESLRQSNSYIRETIVFANMIKDNIEDSKLKYTLDSVDQLKSKVETWIETSNESRP